MPHPPRARFPPYLLMLVVSFVLLGLIGYQTLKDRKISGDLLLQNRALQEQVKKEKKKIKELQEDFTRLSTQKEQLSGLKDGLSGQLIELKRVKSLTDEGKRKLESSLVLKENEVKELREKLALLDKKEEQLKLMKKEMMRKDAEIGELKAQVKAFGKQSSKQSNGDPTEKNQNTVSEGKEKHGTTEMVEQQPVAFRKVSKKEKKSSEFDEEDSTADAMMDEPSKKRFEMSKDKSRIEEDVDPEDEESQVDDREESLIDETGDDAEPDKTHDEDDADDQPEIDMDAVNKSDLDENEMAAMER